MSKIRDLGRKLDEDGDEIDFLAWQDEDDISDICIAWHRKITPHLGDFDKTVRWQLENRIIEAVGACSKHVIQNLKAKKRRREYDSTI